MVYKKGLAYTGSKYKILSFIKEVLSENEKTKKLIKNHEICCDNYIDYFCGGLNLALNVSANKYLLSDVNELELYKSLFLEYDATEIIYKFDCLDKIYLYTHNVFNDTKNVFNKQVSPFFKEYYYGEKMYALAFFLLYFRTHSRNNYIRFNSKNEFNVQYGYRKHNNNVLIDIHNFINNNKNEILCLDYQTMLKAHVYCETIYKGMEDNAYNENSLLVLDPPYYNSINNYHHVFNMISDTKINAWNTKEYYKFIFPYINFIQKTGTTIIMFDFIYNKSSNIYLNSFIDKLQKHNIKYELHYTNKKYQCSYNKKDNIQSEVMLVI